MKNLVLTLKSPNIKKENIVNLDAYFNKIKVNAPNALQSWNIIKKSIKTKSSN